jgi:hypothetical protein
MGCLTEMTHRNPDPMASMEEVPARRGTCYLKFLNLCTDMGVVMKMSGAKYFSAKLMSHSEQHQPCLDGFHTIACET